MNESRSTAIPQVSVILPVYNAGEHLHAAIQSILDQTFTDLEFIIINDGSTDGSDQVIRSFTDPRIQYITTKNQGLASSLNQAIASSKAPLIARHDHDDMAHPDRLTRQVDHLQRHPEVGLLGTWAEVVSNEEKIIGVLEHPTDHASICYALLFDSPFVHPSVIFRRDVFEKTGGYDPDPTLFEDLDLWQRMAEITEVANLPEHLLQYRSVPTGMSRIIKSRLPQLMNCRRKHMQRLFPDLAGREFDLLTSIGIDHPLITDAELRSLHGRLTRYIDSLGNAGVAHRLKQDLHQKLMSYRTIPHRTILHRAIDKLRKKRILSSNSTRTTDRS